MLSFFFRCQRIVACYQLQKNEKLDIKQFYSKRYLYQENFYVKALAISILVFGVLLIALNFILGKLFNKLLTYNFIETKADLLKSDTILFLIFSFVECTIIFTYAFVMIIKNVGQKLKTELIFTALIYFIYMNLSIFK